VNSLRTAGFSNSDISVLLPNKEATTDFARVKGTKAPEGAVLVQREDDSQFIG
jgi:hypothetical protein